MILLVARYCISVLGEKWQGNTSVLGGKYPVDRPTAARVSQCRHRQWANCMMDKTQLEGKWEKQSDRERGRRERRAGWFDHRPSKILGYRRHRRSLRGFAIGCGGKGSEREGEKLNSSPPFFLALSLWRFQKRERNEEESFVGRRRQECGGEGEG